MAAREDSSVLALPSLRVTADLHGLHRAQHAVQMLFGPIRSFKETTDAYSKMRLKGAVEAQGGESMVVGVYSATWTLWKWPFAVKFSGTGSARPQWLGYTLTSVFLNSRTNRYR